MKARLRSSLGFISVATGFFMALLDSTIVTVSLPVITRYYSTNLETITWVLNGYNLAFAVVLVSASRLADQFGRKRIFLTGVSLFSASSQPGIARTKKELNADDAD